MKNIVTGILALYVLVSCAGNTSSSTEDEKTGQTVLTAAGAADSVEQIALKQLFDKVNNLPGAHYNGNEIRIGDTTIAVKIKVEFEGTREGRWIYAANITTSYNAGNPAEISIGSLGVGPGGAEAKNICIEEWFAVFGVPFTDMLNGRNAVSVPGMQVYAGLMGIRGMLPPNTWLTGDREMTKKIITAIQPTIHNTAGNMVPVDIKLLIGKNGIKDGECRIGNQVSAQLLTDLKQLDWPSSADDMMFKQFYWIQKTGTAKK